MRRTASIAFALLAVCFVSCKRENSTAANINAQNKVAMRSVRLYFESEQMLLVPEVRNIALPESASAALPVVVRELMKGPSSPAVFNRLFPADTVVRGVFLLPQGTVIVDLGGSTLTAGWNTGSHQELMAAYSLVQTVVANFADAKRVRLLVNGVPAETLAGHIALTRSLSPLPVVVDPRSR